MSVVKLSEIVTKEIAPNFFSKLIHSESLTFSFVEAKAGSILPEHQHINEQYSYVLDGEIEMMINGEKIVLDKDKFALIGSNLM